MKNVLAVIITTVLLMLLATSVAATGNSGGSNVGVPLPEDYNTPNTVQWSVSAIDGGTQLSNL